MDPTSHHLSGGGGSLGESRYPWMSITGEYLQLFSLDLMRILSDQLETAHLADESSKVKGGNL